MKRNVGNKDKVIRISFGILFFIIFALKIVSGIFGTILLVLGALLILTSIISFCGLYTLFGFSTCKK